MRSKLKSTLAGIALILVAGYFGLDQQAITHFESTTPAPAEFGTSSEDSSSNDNARLAAAFASQRSNVQLEISGIVSRVLGDDNDGSRHQRFIVTVNQGQTVLVAHNIDLAPRVNNIGKGDSVKLFGEYEWNEQGGVMHWTHHDPAGRHIAGYIRHAGVTYQ